MMRAKKNPTCDEEVFYVFVRAKVKKVGNEWGVFRPLMTLRSRFPTWHEALAYALNEGDEE